jgi:hypothetical protein
MQQYMRSRRQQLFGDYSFDDSYVSAYRMSHESYQATEEQLHEDVGKIGVTASPNKWRQKREAQPRNKTRTKVDRQRTPFMVKEFIKFELADAKVPDEETFKLQQRIRESKNLGKTFDSSSQHAKNSTTVKRDVDSSIDESRIIKIMHPVSMMQLPGTIHKVMNMVKAQENNLYKGQANLRYASSELYPIQYGDKVMPKYNYKNGYNNINQGKQKRLHYRLLGKGTYYYPMFLNQPQMQHQYQVQPQPQPQVYPEYQPIPLIQQPVPTYNFIIKPISVPAPVEVKAPEYVHQEEPAKISVQPNIEILYKPLNEGNSLYQGGQTHIIVNSQAQEAEKEPEQATEKPKYEPSYKPQAKEVPNYQTHIVVHPQNQDHGNYNHHQKEPATSYIHFNMPEHPEPPTNYYQSYHYQRTPTYGYQIQQHPNQDEFLYEEQRHEELPEYKLQDIPKMLKPQSYTTVKTQHTQYATANHEKDEKKVEALSSLIGKHPIHQLNGLKQILYNEYAQKPQSNTAPILFHPADQGQQSEAQSPAPVKQENISYPKKYQPSQNQIPINENPVESEYQKAPEQPQQPAKSQSALEEEDDVSSKNKTKTYMFKKKKFTKKSITPMTKFESKKLAPEKHRVSKRSLYGFNYPYSQLEFQASEPVPNIVSPYGFGGLVPNTLEPIVEQPLLPLPQLPISPVAAPTYYHMFQVPAFKKMPPLRFKHKMNLKKNKRKHKAKHHHHKRHRKRPQALKVHMRLMRKNSVQDTLHDQIKTLVNVKKITDLDKLFQYSGNVFSGL